MASGRRAAARRGHGVLAYVAGIGTVVILAGGGYVAWSQTFAPGDDPGDAAEEAPSPRANTPSTTFTPRGLPPRDDPVADANSQCAEEISSAQAVMAAAADGAEHWHLHIQSRTDGMAGLITGEEMREIWRVTRLAGPDDIERFGTAVAPYDETAGSCAEAGQDLPELQECLAHAELATAAVSAARTVIGEWEGHLANMRSFADGGMTAGHAQHEWEEAWARAPDDLERYNTAATALEAAPACT